MSPTNTLIRPEGTLEILSKLEVAKLLDTSESGLHELFRRCSLAVLNSGSNTDDSCAVLAKFQNFDIRVVQQERGIQLELMNAPSCAFVDGVMIKGIREHLFSVLRDIVYTSTEVVASPSFDLSRSEDITSAVFQKPAFIAALPRPRRPVPAAPGRTRGAARRSRRTAPRGRAGRAGSSRGSSSGPLRRGFRRDTRRPDRS